MIYYLIQGLTFAAIMYATMIVFHEGGHYVVLNYYRREPKIRFIKGVFVLGTPQDYEGLSSRQLREVYVNGIYGGLIPLAMFCLFCLPYWYLPLILLIPYGLGCKDDIQLIIRLKYGIHK